MTGTANTLNAIQEFVANLENASCQGTQRDAVEILAKRVGKMDARRIAESFGLFSEFFFANIE
jgi:hypothetical protein